MSTAALTAEQGTLPAGPDALLEQASAAVAAADKILQAAKSGVSAKVKEAGGVDAVQHAAHGLAWLATTVEGLRQMHVWATRLKEEGRFGEFEQLILAAAFAEYLSQIAGGIPMSQGEIIRPEAMGVSRADVRQLEDETPIASGRMVSPWFIGTPAKIWVRYSPKPMRTIRVSASPSAPSPARRSA